MVPQVPEPEQCSEASSIAASFEVLVKSVVAFPRYTLMHSVSCDISGDSGISFFRLLSIHARYVQPRIASFRRQCYVVYTFHHDVLSHNQSSLHVKSTILYRDHSDLHGTLFQPCK